MTEEPRLDVLLRERLLKQRVVVEIDLTDRKVVGRPPVRIHHCPLFIRQRIRHHCLPIRPSRPKCDGRTHEHWIASSGSIPTTAGPPTTRRWAVPTSAVIKTPVPSGGQPEVSSSQQPRRHRDVREARGDRAAPERQNLLVPAPP